MGVTSFQQSLYEFFDSGLLFRIALLQKTILFLLFQLPHRGFDGHIRVSSYEGESTSKAEPYANARNSTLENLLPLFDLSPETVIFGGWDSTRSKNQLRIPSILVGETYAVLAEQNEDPAIHRAGGRVDPVGASINVDSKNDRVKIVGDSVDLSDKTKASFETPNADCGLTDEQIHAALDWLEGNPPQEILFPRVISAGNKAVAYRNKGNVQDWKKPKDKKSPAAAYIATAYKQHPESGMVLTWVWHENPSSEIARTLSSLCGEVPYLGEACSVVELRTHEDYGFPVDAGKLLRIIRFDVMFNGL